jgi:hypothetical protein
MPTLNWIGKDAVVKHHQDVPFRLLEPVPELSCGDPASGNLIVQGDNLHALKALLPRFAGQVKCIYIDPPYNTGNEGWAYNDNVNSPEIRKWLSVVVGKEGETLDRHDRWLCIMYPRLVLLRQFLREDGAIFVSIDDNEVATLRMLMDDIFGGEISPPHLSGRRWIARMTTRYRSHPITNSSCATNAPRMGRASRRRAMQRCWMLTVSAARMGDSTAIACPRRSARTACVRTVRPCTSP